MQFGYGLVSICIKNHPSLLTGGEGWYYYYCIFDYFGVFWASEQWLLGHTVCLIVQQLVILKNGQYGDMISVINDFDTHPNFHYNSNHDASKNTVYQVPFHSTFPISIVFLRQRKVTCLLIFPFAFYSEIFYTSGFTTTHVVVSVRHPITY